MAAPAQSQLAVGDGSVALVLLSGGIDSAALIALAKARGFAVHALHVSYGQAAEEAEAMAAAGIAAAFGVPLRCCSYRGSQFAAGEIRGRNWFLLATALLEFPAHSGVVLIGIHGGTDYVDCSPGFLERAVELYELQTRGTIAVEAPFIDLLKGDVVRIADELEVPLDSTHSCEAGNSSCGTCQSCLDRARLLAELHHVGA